MFMLYSILIGLAIGLLLGGRIGRLADLHLAWVPLAVAALIVQFILFDEQLNGVLGSLVPPIYVASTAVVLAVVLRNLRKAAGLALVALGTISNLAAIVANGGYMPVTAEALGVDAPTVPFYGGNSVLTANPILEPLVDRFVMPAWLPLTNIFSVGDVLIAAGIVIVMVVGMRQTDSGPATTSSLGPAGSTGDLPVS